MSEDNALVLVAGYQDRDRAREDFDALTGQVRGKQITLRGAVLVTKDPDGNLTVIDTGDHLGRKGADGGCSQHRRGEQPHHQADPGTPAGALYGPDGRPCRSW